MESVCVRQVIYATHNHSFPKRRKHPINPIHGRRFQYGVIHSKQSSFQDFQGYAKPSRLSAATEVKVCTETSQEMIFPSSSVDGSEFLFKVKLQTSNFYGSSLSNINAGILLCLIDENGNSILQRIPASSTTNHSAESEETVDPDILHFQRGSVDEFSFKGPKLGKIEALWIGLESGQWRLGGLSLTVISAHQPTLEENGVELQYFGCQYDFEADDFLLGEGSDISMVELRPRIVTELSGVDPFTLLSRSLPQSSSLFSSGISNEESMKEYANLKFSLLLYDAILIFVGTSVASFSVGESSAFAFLIGGITGFLYLLLLQRSVDELPAPASISRNANFDRKFGLKGPISSLALAVGVSLLAAKYSLGDVSLVLTPKELLVGMMGFIACKLAVLLAAFKPIPVDLKENK